MDELEHLTVAELNWHKVETLACVENLEAELYRQQTKLKWIDKYISEKKPQELTMEQIEQKLGHKVILK